MKVMGDDQMKVSGQLIAVLQGSWVVGWRSITSKRVLKKYLPALCSVVLEAAIKDASIHIHSGVYPFYTLCR